MTRAAIASVVITIVALVIATVLVTIISSGAVSVDGIINAQRHNAALWTLDCMPLIFALWDRYTNSLVNAESKTMAADQTQEMPSRTGTMQYQVMHEATHDALTDLPNRVLLRDRLQQAIRAAQRDKSVLAVLILGLDRFKDINDALGNHQGDRLLKQVASRLRNVVREADTLARLGGDEFALILRQPGSAEDIATLIDKIEKILASPFSLNGAKWPVRASIGGALFPAHGSDVDTLLERADTAAYVAKQKKSGFVIYSDQLNHDHPRRLTLISELRNAIANDELTLRFQPIMDSHNYQVGEVEALVRWEHRHHGIMVPDEFIPLAERSGLIQPLTLWVVRHALKQQSEWRGLGLEVSMAVNISAQTLLDNELPEQVHRLLVEHQVPPRHLILEITESSIMFDQELAMHVLSRFAEMGVKIAVDDFGTGYSSLKYLRHLPVSQLKIDKSFVLDMLDNENDEVIVNATIDLGHNLGLQVVAEGVENAETLQKLRTRGCDAVQGYHINYPLRSEDLMPWYYSNRGPCPPAETKEDLRL